MIAYIWHRISFPLCYNVKEKSTFTPLKIKNIAKSANILIENSLFSLIAYLNAYQNIHMDTGPRFSTSNILFTFEMLYLIRYEIITNWYIFSSNCFLRLFFEIGAVGDCERTSTHTMLTNLIRFACLLSSSDSFFTSLQALGSRLSLYPSSWESVEKVF